MHPVQPIFALEERVRLVGYLINYLSFFETLIRSISVPKVGDSEGHVSKLFFNLRAYIGEMKVLTIEIHMNDK